MLASRACACWTDKAMLIFTHGMFLVSKHGCGFKFRQWNSEWFHQSVLLYCTSISPLQYNMEFYHELSSSYFKSSLFTSTTELLEKKWKKPLLLFFFSFLKMCHYTANSPPAPRVMLSSIQESSVQLNSKNLIYLFIYKFYLISILFIHFIYLLNCPGGNLRHAE